MTMLSQLIDTTSQLEDYRYFPSLFGNGSSGSLTISSNTDCGYAGAFGLNQFTTLTLNSGIQMQVPAGSGNGGIILAVRDVFNFNGSIIADGQNATSGTVSRSGNSGGGAGGLATATSPNTTDGNAQAAAFPSPARLGAGARGGYGSFTNVINHPEIANTSASGTLPSSVQPVQRFPGYPFDQTVTVTTNVQNYSNSALTGFSKYALFGGGARCGAATLLGTGSAKAWGGGSGGGGGLIYLMCNHINFGGSSAISAKGGNGGNGDSNKSDFTGYGGSGGQGGRVIIICNTYSGTPPTPVLTGGTNGTDGTNGTPAGGGASGFNGESFFLSIKGQV